MGEIVQLNQEEVKRQLSELVRGTVEETLNRLLDKGADRITNAHWYERTEERLFARLCEGGLLAEDHSGGCVLFEKEQVRRLLVG